MTVIDTRFGVYVGSLTGRVRNGPEVPAANGAAALPRYLQLQQPYSGDYLGAPYYETMRLVQTVLVKPR